VHLIDLRYRLKGSASRAVVLVNRLSDSSFLIHIEVVQRSGVSFGLRYTGYIIGVLTYRHAVMRGNDTAA
jgi:hypothetical protein